MKDKITYHIITIGCQMNRSDSERIAGVLEGQGYKRVDNRNSASLIVVNTCGIRQSAENRVYGLIPKIKKDNPKAKIILAGCLSERKDVQKRLVDKVDMWLPIRELPNLGSKTKNKFQDCDYLKLPPKYESKFSAFVPIGNGCNNYCAYCVVPYARGREVYRPAKEILAEIRQLVKKGYKEIVLVAQNVNSYCDNVNAANNMPARLTASAGRARQMPRIANAVNSKYANNKVNCGEASGYFANAQDDKSIINFAKLLRLVDDIDGEFWIRFFTSHPKDMSDELIEVIAKSDKICEYVHLPVQAGDNEILNKMNRKYTRQDYIKLVGKIKRAIPGVSITTDVIVGFPGETGRQFNNTVKLFKEMKFDMAYISKYSPRPGTAAYKLEDDVPLEEKKKWEGKLIKILSRTALENNKKYINKIVEVLIEGRNKKGELYGKTRTNKAVKVVASEKLSPLKRDPAKAGEVRSEKSLVGEFVRVKIKKAQGFGLKGALK